MNLGITLARTGSTWEVITTPDVPLSAQRRNFRNLRQSLSGSIDELQLWSSGQGRIKRQAFSKSPVSQPELALDSSVSTGTETGGSEIAVDPATAGAPLTGLAKVNADRKAAKAAAKAKTPASSVKSKSKSAGKAKAAAQKAQS